MDLPALAAEMDLTIRGVDTSNSTRVQAILSDVSGLIHFETGNVWVTDDGTLAATIPPVVKTVAIKAARRALENPEQIESERIGTGYQATYANASPDVYLTPREQALVRRAAGISSLGTISTTRGPLETPDVRPCDIDDVDDLGGPWER